MIIIDPGHGGPDPGAVGPAGTREAAINMMISRKLVEMIANQGYQGITAAMTHDGPGIQPGAAPNPELNARTRFIHAQKPEIVISNHCNAAASPSARGMEIFHYPDSVSGRLLAERVYPALIQVCQVYGIPGRGIKTANFAMTREPARAGAAGILIEYAFISNPAEEKILNDISFQDQAAAAVMRGVLAYMGVASKPTEPTAWEKQQQTAAEWVRGVGISDGSRPGDPITRGELFVILQALASRGAIKL